VQIQTPFSQVRISFLDVFLPEGFFIEYPPAVPDCLEEPAVWLDVDFLRLSVDDTPESESVSLFSPLLDIVRMDRIAYRTVYRGHELFGFVRR
jgi:hypothetical protein